MASFEIPVDEDGTGVQTLAGDTVDTVTIAAGAASPRGRGPRDVVRVIGGGEFDIFVTFDGVTPATDGTQGHRLPAGAVSVLEEEIEAGEGGEVKLISADAATYSVEVH